ncbi:transporter substrate-binding domain-containing protein [Paralcaligenes ureilyticus]|uniref:Amino acid ABC transporter substrate-binding protein (PAAT family) n=1 Tax=Paralcaligenes ureilyticus TaxID=627131 RepID=A0A4R3M021_9BURK|nr:transporter substrate-binding domain-containing protein [Paralcaligenes ureilyticus]TCT06394.1 amino acid ABC transporter substrate-binding protein (PAAT family) [Paralcaligenes ureilyticus]
MNTKGFTIKAAVLALTLGLAAGATAAELSGTLAKIKDNNLIVLGYRESSIPLSYVDAGTNQVVGYSHEIALKVVDAIKADLKLPNLKVREIPITAQNRISLMQNGTIDLGCNGTTNNEARRRQVAFSNTIAITETQLLTKKTSGIHDIADLKGKSVAVTAGSTSEKFMRNYVHEKNMDTVVVSAKDHAQAFLMVQTNRAAAFFMDTDVLSSLIGQSPHPADYIITGEPQTREALACMFRKDDPQFKAVVDKTIHDMQVSGAAEKLYNKWFMSPIPPDNKSLNVPLSADMKALFSHPNDRSYN